MLAVKMAGALEDVLKICRILLNAAGFGCFPMFSFDGSQGSLDSARNFVLEMLQRMQPLRERDLQRMGKRKNKDLSSGKDDNGADATRKRKAEALNEHGLDAWDVSFYGDLLKREELLLDDEKLKEFFPLEGTIERILEVGRNYR